MDPEAAERERRIQLRDAERRARNEGDTNSVYYSAFNTAFSNASGTGAKKIPQNSAPAVQLNRLRELAQYHDIPDHLDPVRGVHQVGQFGVSSQKGAFASVSVTPRANSSDSSSKQRRLIGEYESPSKQPSIVRNDSKIANGGGWVGVSDTEGSNTVDNKIIPKKSAAELRKIKERMKAEYQRYREQNPHWSEQEALDIWFSTQKAQNSVAAVTEYNMGLQPSAARSAADEKNAEKPSGNLTDSNANQQHKDFQAQQQHRDSQAQKQNENADLPWLSNPEKKQQVKSKNNNFLLEESADAINRRPLIEDPQKTHIHLDFTNGNPPSPSNKELFQPMKGQVVKRKGGEMVLLSPNRKELERREKQREMSGENASNLMGDPPPGPSFANNYNMKENSSTGHPLKAAARPSPDGLVNQRMDHEMHALKRAMNPDLISEAMQQRQMRKETKELVPLDAFDDPNLDDMGGGMMGGDMRSTNIERNNERPDLNSVQKLDLTSNGNADNIGGGGIGNENDRYNYPHANLPPKFQHSSPKIKATFNPKGVEHMKKASFMPDGSEQEKKRKDDARKVAEFNQNHIHLKRARSDYAAAESPDVGSEKGRFQFHHNPITGESKEHGNGSSGELNSIGNPTDISGNPIPIDVGTAMKRALDEEIGLPEEPPRFRRGSDDRNSIGQEQQVEEQQFDEREKRDKIGVFMRKDKFSHDDVAFQQNIPQRYQFPNIQSKERDDEPFLSGKGVSLEIPSAEYEEAERKRKARLALQYNKREMLEKELAKFDAEKEAQDARREASMQDLHREKYADYVEKYGERNPEQNGIGNLFPEKDPGIVDRRKELVREAQEYNKRKFQEKKPGNTINEALPSKWQPREESSIPNPNSNQGGHQNLNMYPEQHSSDIDLMNNRDLMNILHGEDLIMDDLFLDDKGLREKVQKREKELLAAEFNLMEIKKKLEGSTAAAKVRIGPSLERGELASNPNYIVGNKRPGLRDPSTGLAVDDLIHRDGPNVEGRGSNDPSSNVGPNSVLLEAEEVRNSRRHTNEVAAAEHNKRMMLEKHESKKRVLNAQLAVSKEKREDLKREGDEAAGMSDLFRNVNRGCRGQYGLNHAYLANPCFNPHLSPHAPNTGVNHAAGMNAAFYPETAECGIDQRGKTTNNTLGGIGSDIPYGSGGLRQLENLAAKYGNDGVLESDRRDMEQRLKDLEDLYKKAEGSNRILPDIAPDDPILKSYFEVTDKKRREMGLQNQLNDAYNTDSLDSRAAGMGDNGRPKPSLSPAIYRDNDLNQALREIASKNGGGGPAGALGGGLREAMKRIDAGKGMERQGSIEDGLMDHYKERGQELMSFYSAISPTTGEPIRGKGGGGALNREKNPLIPDTCENWRRQEKKANAAEDCAKINRELWVEKKERDKKNAGAISKDDDPHLGRGAVQTYDSVLNKFDDGQMIPFPDNRLERKESKQRLEMDLLEQIQEKKTMEEERKKKKLAEERADDERIKRERDEEERRLQVEKESKKRLFLEAQEANKERIIKRKKDVEDSSYLSKGEGGGVALGAAQGSNQVGYTRAHGRADGYGSDGDRDYNSKNPQSFFEGSDNYYNKNDAGGDSITGGGRGRRRNLSHLESSIAGGSTAIHAKVAGIGSAENLKESPKAMAEKQRSILQQQMEEVSRRREEEKRKERDAEEREEARVKREIEAQKERYATEKREEEERRRKLTTISERNHDYTGNHQGNDQGLPGQVQNLGQSSFSNVSSPAKFVSRGRLPLIQEESESKMQENKDRPIPILEGQHHNQYQASSSASSAIGGESYQVTLEDSSATSVDGHGFNANKLSPGKFQLPGGMAQSTMNGMQNQHDGFFGGQNSGGDTLMNSLLSNQALVLKNQGLNPGILKNSAMMNSSALINAGLSSLAIKMSSSLSQPSSARGGTMQNQNGEPILGTNPHTIAETNPHTIAETNPHTSNFVRHLERQVEQLREQRDTARKIVFEIRDQKLDEKAKQLKLLKESLVEKLRNPNYSGPNGAQLGASIAGANSNLQSLSQHNSPFINLSLNTIPHSGNVTNTLNSTPGRGGPPNTLASLRSPNASPGLMRKLRMINSGGPDNHQMQNLMRSSASVSNNAGSQSGNGGGDPFNLDLCANSTFKGQDETIGGIMGYNNMSEMLLPGRPLGMQISGANDTIVGNDTLKDNTIGNNTLDKTTNDRFDVLSRVMEENLKDLRQQFLRNSLEDATGLTLQTDNNMMRIPFELQQQMKVPNPNLHNGLQTAQLGLQPGLGLQGFAHGMAGLDTIKPGGGGGGGLGLDTIHESIQSIQESAHDYSSIIAPGDPFLTDPLLANLSRNEGNHSQIDIANVGSSQLSTSLSGDSNTLKNQILEDRYRMNRGMEGLLEELRVSVNENSALKTENQLLNKSVNGDTFGASLGGDSKLMDDKNKTFDRKDLLRDLLAMAEAENSPVAGNAVGGNAVGSNAVGGNLGGSLASNPAKLELGTKLNTNGSLRDSLGKLEMNTKINSGSPKVSENIPGEGNVDLGENVELGSVELGSVDLGKQFDFGKLNPGESLDTGGGASVSLGENANNLGSSMNLGGGLDMGETLNLVPTFDIGPGESLQHIEHSSLGKIELGESLDQTTVS